MSQCKECGATLPENARSCPQCGADNARATSAAEGPQKELDFLKPALAGGAALGVTGSVIALISSLAPILGLLNITCCLWVPGGGAFGAYLLNKQRPGTLKYGDGAIVGAISGVFGAVVSTILGIPLRLMQTARLEQASEQIRQSQMPPGMKDFILQMTAPGINITVLLIGFCFAAVLYAIVATAGGSLAVAVINRKKIDN